MKHYPLSAATPYHCPENGMQSHSWVKSRSVLALGCKVDYCDQCWLSRSDLELEHAVWELRAALAIAARDTVNGAVSMLMKWSQAIRKRSR